MYPDVRSPAPPALLDKPPLRWVPLVLAALAYANTLGFGFVWDDAHLIVDNTVLRQGSPMPIVLSHFWQEGESSDLYRPLVSATYFLEFKAWKLWAAGYHATNIVAHLAATAGVMMGARLMFGSGLAAVIAGVTFALHPVHTESVAFIAGRSDLLAAAFGLAAFALHLRRGGASGGAVALLAAALLCKEAALAFLAVLVIYELALGERPGIAAGSRAGWPTRLGRLWPYAAVSAAYLGVRWLVLGAPVTTAVNATPLATRTVMTINALGDYARLLVFPFPAAPHRVPDGVLTWYSVVIGTGLITACALALACWRCSRVPFFLLGWLLLTLAPSSPLVWGRAPQVAERYLYIPSVALAWFVAWVGLIAWPKAAGTFRASLVVTAAGLTAAALGLTAVRNLDWQDGAHLFTRMAISEPRSHLAAVNLGYLYLEEGQLSQAEEAFNRTLALAPRLPAALLGLAVIESQRGRHELAIQRAERARALDPRPDLVHAQLGTIYGRAGRYEDAVTSFHESIRRNPRRIHPRLNLVLALADTGRVHQAADALRDVENLIRSQSVAAPGDLEALEHLRRRVAADRPSK
jgi:protein O-mannosyl-transferase